MQVWLKQQLMGSGSVPELWSGTFGPICLCFTSSGCNSNKTNKQALFVKMGVLHQDRKASALSSSSMLGPGSLRQRDGFNFADSSPSAALWVVLRDDSSTRLTASGGRGFGRAAPPPVLSPLSSYVKTLCSARNETSRWVCSQSEGLMRSFIFSRWSALHWTKHATTTTTTTYCDF